MTRVASRVMDLLVWSLARARLLKLNRFMFNLSIRALGILNYRNSDESGENNLLRRVLSHYRRDDGTMRGVILDVGANVGAYSREILQITPSASVYCFEPGSGNVGILEASLGTHVTVVPVAVGSKAGSIELYDYEEGDGSSHASLHREVFERIHQRPHTSRVVPVTTIDDYVRQHSIDFISLLKVDVEGHELEVLKGATTTIREKKVDVVQFEFNEMNVVTRVFLSDFFDVLPDFVFFRLLPHGWIPVSNRPLDNIFAFQNIVAVRSDASVLALFEGR